LVCHSDVRLTVNPDRPNDIVPTWKKCPSTVAKHPKQDCPFIRHASRKVFGLKNGIYQESQARYKWCYAGDFGNGRLIPPAISSNLLSKLPPSTWETMVCGVKFSDYIIRVSIEARMELYAANGDLRTKRMENTLLGWGCSDPTLQQQLVGQTFRIYQQEGVATYTIRRVLFGCSKNINGFRVTSSLDGETSPEFVMGVRAHRDGYVVFLKFSCIHPFPRMSRAYRTRYLYHHPIRFDRCPNTVLWISATMY